MGTIKAWHSLNLLYRLSPPQISGLDISQASGLHPEDMSRDGHTYTQIPRKLLDELSISSTQFSGRGKQGRQISTRKELRKKAKAEKKSDQKTRWRTTVGQKVPLLNQGGHGFEENGVEKRQPISNSSEQSTPLKSILKTSKKHSIPSPPPSPPLKVSKSVSKRIAEDDAAIEALESKLGLKSKTKLPKSFKDDALDTLLEGLEEPDGPENAQRGKRKRPEDEEWLSRKRSKGRGSPLDVDSATEKESTVSLESDQEIEQSHIDDSDTWDSMESEVASGPEKASLDAPSFANIPKARENPYAPPMDGKASYRKGKYVPPSLRQNDESPEEDHPRLRRQINGLLNRLSESNLVTVLLEVEKIYQNHPRHQVSSSLLQMLTEILSDPASLQDTFIILHTGFIAALYKVVGTDFGAYTIETLHDQFSHLYDKSTGVGDPSTDGADRRLVNLIHVFAELYNFRVIASNLIYDLIRLLLNTFSEANTELLLKVIRNCGVQLRHDDPSSLNAISVLLQEGLAQADEKVVSVRTKFMVETIEDLKKNRAKNGKTASIVSNDHRTVMKKTLGSLNQRSLKTSEPLRIGLRDLQEAEKRGKWWLIGSTFKDEEGEVDEEGFLGNPTIDRDLKDDETMLMSNSILSNSISDLADLAKAQRMNTDIRRSIFIVIMSATDYNDAFLRLQKLRLKKSQELEIPKVLLHCAGIEETSNPFYFLLARKFCGDRKLKKAFEFSLWDFFKRMGEGGEEYEASARGQDDNENDEGSVKLRSLVNLGKLYGGLIADGGLTLGILKVGGKHSIL